MPFLKDKNDQDSNNSKECRCSIIRQCYRWDFSTFVKHMQALGVQPRWSTEYEREFEIVVRMHKQDHFACSTLYAHEAWKKLVGNKFQHGPGVVIKKSPTGHLPTRRI